jgi:hypothetical protein
MLTEHKLDANYTERKAQNTERNLECLILITPRLCLQ